MDHNPGPCGIQSTEICEKSLGKNSSSSLSNDEKGKSLRHHETTSRGLLLLHYHQVPRWQQDNKYLLSGYRTTAQSTYECFWSSFQWHNETINILSHILGSALFAVLPWHFCHEVYARNPDAQAIDLVLFSVYLIGVSICFACSACCHILWNHSPAVSAYGGRVDYLGIILLMWTASLPSIYYGFHCDPKRQQFHWLLTSFLAVSCIVVTLQPRFSSPLYRNHRAYLYTALGLTAFLSVAHSVWVYGFELSNKRMALPWMLVTSSMNVIGTVAYASRLPERIFPYHFDLVGASHQIFHVMVIVAGLTHYVGLIQAFSEVRSARNACNGDVK